MNAKLTDDPLALKGGTTLLIVFKEGINIFEYVTQPVNRNPTPAGREVTGQ